MHASSVNFVQGTLERTEREAGSPDAGLRADLRRRLHYDRDHVAPADRVAVHGLSAQELDEVYDVKAACSVDTARLAAAVEGGERRWVELTNT